MANVKMTTLPIDPSIELFIQHRKVWHNYKDSIVLVDPSFKIIAYWDNKTANIDIIMSDIEHRRKFIVVNGIPKECEPPKYEPIILAKELFPYEDEIKTLRKNNKQATLKKLFEKVKWEVDEKNINFFSNIGV